MPTIVLFDNGVATDKIIGNNHSCQLCQSLSPSSLGFEGLADGMAEGKEDEWSTVVLARLLAKKGFLDSKLVVDPESETAIKEEKLQEMRNNITRGLLLDMDEDDFDLDNIN